MGWRWPWQKRDRTAGQLVSGVWLKGMLENAIPEVGIVKRLDKMYLAQEASITKSLVADAWNPALMTYHGNSEEFPDCDDFSIRAWGAVLARADSLGMTHAPCFGIICLTFKTGVRHLMNLAVSRDGGVYLYEPQTGEWSQDFSKIFKVRWVMI